MKLSLSKSFHKSRLAPRDHLRPDGIVMMMMRVLFLEYDDNEDEDGDDENDCDLQHFKTF